MLNIGFIEEIIFRGFLFRALTKHGINNAVLISNIIFGIGHILNLFCGAELISTLVQIIYSISIGYLYATIFHSSGSLLPCIITHQAINSLCIFNISYHLCKIQIDYHRSTVYHHQLQFFLHHLSS